MGPPLLAPHTATTRLPTFDEDLVTMPCWSLNLCLFSLCFFCRTTTLWLVKRIEDSIRNNLQFDWTMQSLYWVSKLLSMNSSPLFSNSGGAEMVLLRPILLVTTRTLFSLFLHPREICPYPLQRKDFACDFACDFCPHCFYWEEYWILLSILNGTSTSSKLYSF